MGGIAIDVDDRGPRNDTPFADIKVERFTLTARGVIQLAECGIILDIRAEDIKDKSKADSLAKIIVVLQAIWMFVQTAGRLIARLPVTLLEVHTVAHALCALLMYYIWWHKPRQVVVQQSYQYRLLLMNSFREE